MKFELEFEQAQEFVELVRNYHIDNADKFERLKRSKKGVRVEVKAWRESKTPEQVGYYWSVIEGAAKHIGDSVEGLHEDLMFEAGLFEHKETMRGRKIRRLSSNDLDVEQYIKLIDTLGRVSGMNGYTLPPPRKRNDRTGT